MSGPGRPEPIRPTTPIQPAPVRDWRLDDGAHLDRAFRAAAGDTPEQAARVLSLSRRTGFTPAFVKDNFDVLERESAKETFDARAFSQSSPLVADWLAQDPSRVALMGRDLTRMGMVERQARNIVARFQQGRRQTELLRIGEAALQGTITPAQRERQRALEAQRPEDFGLEGFFEGAPGAAAEQLPILGRTIAAGGVGGLVGGVAGAVVGGAVGKSPASAQVGASFGMRIGAGTAVAYDVAVMEASGAMLDYERLEGLDPETARGAALIAGAISGSLELLSLKQLASVTPGLRDLSRSGVRSLLTNPTTRELLLETARGIGLSAATEGATETLQSLITQGGGTIAAAAESGRLETDLAGVIAEVFGPDAMAQALAEGRAGAQSGLLLASVGGAGSLTQDVVAARRAERQAEAIATLADAGGDAEVTAKAPDEVSAMVTELRQAGLSGFSYDAETWRTFWQSAKDEQGNAIDPAAVAAEVLGDVTAYQTALASGGTFEVPLGNWLTRLARNPTVREWAVQHAKVGPGEMSAAEAATSAESAEKVLESLVEQAVTQKAEAVPVDEAAAKLAARVEQEVRKAGRPVREAKRAGQLWGEVYRTWAATSGTSAEELAAMFARVRIGDVAAEGEVSLNQSRPITRPELETWLAAEAHRLQTDEPGITPQEIATDLGVPVASVTRYLAAPAPDLTPEAQRALDLRVAFVGTELHQAAFHGSPHLFDKFTTAKMGTGEGSQAYGWGLYFAESQQVAQKYQPRDEKSDAAMLAEYNRAERQQDYETMEVWERAMMHQLPQEIREYYNNPENEAGASLKRKAEAVAKKLAKILKAEKGSLYRVDIPDAVVAKMLDWDKPLSEQPAVMAALRKTVSDDFIERAEDALNEEMEGWSGKEAYRVLEKYASEGDLEGDDVGITRADEAASKYLAREGIPGIKFLDAGSRSSGEGTRNLVIFDENDVTITHRNGEPVTAAERAQVLEQSGKAETLPATIDIDGTPRPTTNANGHPIALTEQGVRNFWAWFGDSKVVDAEGRPLVVYHGTTVDFTEFDRGKVKSRFPYSMGFHFTNSPTEASVYADGLENAAVEWRPSARFAVEVVNGARVMPVYVKMANPLMVEAGKESASTAIDIDRGVIASQIVASRKAGVAHDGVLSRSASGNVNVVVFGPEQVKSATGNSGAFGPTANILQQSGDAPRGRIRFDAARTQAHIELFEAADASTFFHESAHLFLSLMGQLAASPNATDRIKADYAAALDWLGAKPGEALTVAQEEQFARGFEAYLMEGKAPSLTLRSAFASFANWLTRIYKSIRGLDVELSADIRRIFDRMLATDAAIQEAEESGVREPVFLGSDEVMPAAEAAKYGEAIVRATEAATEALRAEVLSVIAREEKAWFKARRAELEPEVRAEVYAEPAYQARSVFQSGKMPDGTALPEGDPLLGRLSKEGVVQLIGEAGAKALPKPVMYRVEGGVHPDVAATAFGYANGTELLAALMGTQHIEKEIRQRTETRLRQEYGDPLTDGTMPALAVQAIQTAERDRVIQMELEEMRRRDPAAVRGLLRRFGGRIPVTAEVMQQADAMLATRTIRDIRPIEFQRAEVKAAKAAIAAAVKGDWATAAEQKIRERLSLALTRAAIEAHAAIDKAETRFTRYFRPDDVLAKTRDMNLVNAARATLARVGIGRAEKSPEEYLKAVRQYDAETADDLDALIDTSVPPREDSRDLTLAEFRQVDANATGLWEQAKRTQQMVIDGKKMARAQIVDEMGAELETMPDRMKGAGRTKAFTTGDTIRRRLLGAEAALRRVESWVDQLDGGNIHGIFRRYLWTPISEASAAFRVAKRDMTQRYLDIVKRIPADRLTGGPFAAPEINYTFRDRQELLGAMLHTGNLSNKDKLLRGRGWDVSQWDAMERRMFTARILDESDVRFLNEVWALFESVKPEAQRVHKAMLGTYFDEITAVPRETGGGTLTGGYVPAMADTMLNEDAAMRNEKKEQEAVNPSTMFPSVNRGFTKSRVDAYAAPLIMDLRLIRTHIDAVTKFIHLAEPTRDLGRLLLDRRFRGALAAVDPEMGSELAAWAQRAGSQVVETPSRGGGGKTADTIFRWFRSTAGLNMMALNVQNTLQQFTGLSIAAVKVPPTYLRNALWQVVRQPKQMHEAIAARSPYMATRVTASVMDVERRIDQLITNPNAYQQAKAFAREHGYILQSTAQGLVDAVVWQGAFDWATANGLDETMAVRQADAAVRLTQGSFAPEDVSRFETGSPFVRAFTMFYSYFNMQANLLRSEFAQEMRKSGLRKGAGRMLYVYTLGFMVPAVLSQAILEGLAGHADDDDDEGELSDWMAVFFGSQVRTAFALVPGGNILVQAGINQFNDKWYDDRVSVSPAVTTIEQGGRGIGAVYDWWSGEEVQRRDIKDVLTLLSLASGFPFGGLARPLTYLYDVEQGTAEPTGPVDFTRGLVSGRP